MPTHILGGFPFTCQYPQKANNGAGFRGFYALKISLYYQVKLGAPGRTRSSGHTGTDFGISYTRPPPPGGG